MKLFYRAVTKDNKVVRGLIEAKSIDEAAIYLRNHEMTPVKISEPEKGISGMMNFGKKAKSSDLVFFTRQLSSMLTSGLTLMQSLTILRKQVQNQEMSDVVQGVIASVEEGSSLSDAMEKYPKIFTPIYIALIKAAESSGLLDKVLLRLSENLEKQEKLKSTIKSALMYPILVIIMMFIVMAIMMIFVIPQLSVLYENLDVDLPLPTQIVIGISNIFVNAWWLMIGIGVGVFYFYKRWSATESGKLVLDALFLKIPIFGKLIQQSIMTEFTRTFGLLVGTGSLVVDSLVKSSDVVGNSIYKREIIQISRRVEKGISVGDAMENSAHFPPIVVEMVKIGEQTGKLDESLTRVSEYFEREVEQTVKTLTTAMEPIIMIVLAVGVGFLILSIITPIYNLISSIS